MRGTRRARSRRLWPGRRRRSQGRRSGRSVRHRPVGTTRAGPRPLRQRIASSVGFFWQESFGQLFPTLADLEKEGLVIGRQVADGKRRRRDYEITPAGEAALGAWLHEPPALQSERNEMLLKVFFANPGDVGALGSFIARAEGDARVQIDVLRAIEDSLRESYATDPRLPFWVLTVRYGILGNEALLRWCKEARRALAASA